MKFDVRPLSDMPAAIDKGAAKYAPLLQAWKTLPQGKALFVQASKPTGQACGALRAGITKTFKKLGIAVESVSDPVNGGVWLYRKGDKPATEEANATRPLGASANGADSRS